MAVFEPKIVFLGILDTLCTCVFVAKIVYSDSAHGELSFGTKTGSLGPCVPILLPNLGLRADFGP